MISWLAQYSGYAVLLAFFVAFGSIAAWAYWPSNRTRLEQHKGIPLKEDTNGGS